MNNGDGTFSDVTKEAIGFDTKKGMNVDVADYDSDGWLDVYVTNITDEYMKECNMLWHNNGDGTFTDLSKETGTCNTLWGWAAKFADFDNDGWEDLFAANGLRSAGRENYIPVLVEMIIRPGVDFTDVNSWPAIGTMSWSGYQKKKLFRNLGDQTFKEVSAEAGVDNDHDGRGVAVADFDNDGRLDFYQTNADQDALLYRNISTDRARSPAAGSGSSWWARSRTATRSAPASQCVPAARPGARGQRRQRLRQPEHRAPALRPRGGGQGRRDRDPLAERPQGEGERAARPGHHDPGREGRAMKGEPRRRGLPGRAASSSPPACRAAWRSASWPPPRPRRRPTPPISLPGRRSSGTTATWAKPSTRTRPPSTRRWRSSGRRWSWRPRRPVSG